MKNKDRVKIFCDGIRGIRNNLNGVDNVSKEQKIRENLLEKNLKKELENIKKNKLTIEKQKEIKNKLINVFNSFNIEKDSKEDVAKVFFRDQKGRFVSKKNLKEANIGVDFQRHYQGHLEDSRANIKDIYSENIKLIPELEVDKILKDISSKLETIIKESCDNIKKKFLKEQNDFDLILNGKEINNNIFKMSNDKFLISDSEYCSAKHILFSKFIIKIVDLLNNNLEVPVVQPSYDSSKGYSPEESADCRVIDLGKKSVSYLDNVSNEELTKMFKNSVPKKNNINSDIKKVTPKIPKIIDKTTNQNFSKMQDKVKEIKFRDKLFPVNKDYVTEDSEVNSMHEESMREIEAATGKSFKKYKKSKNL